MGTFSEHDVILASEALRLGYVTQEALQWCRAEMDRQFGEGLSPALHRLLEQHQLIQAGALQYLLQQYPAPHSSVAQAESNGFTRIPRATSTDSVDGDNAVTQLAYPVPPQSSTSLTIVRELARGGMGVVYEVTDAFLGRSLAMKKSLAEEVSPEFFEEARVTGQLEHPNIIPIHRAGFGPDGKPYFTMKLVRGKTFEEMLHEHAENADPHQRLLEQLDIFLKIGDGLAFAHSKRVVHRDLKPENIMIGEYGEVLVMDWGIARVRGRPSRRRFGIEEGLKGGATMNDGELAGTPKYMAPEQAACEIDRIGPRTDIYGLGAILYELLAGTGPIELTTEMNKMAILRRVMENDIIPPIQRSPERYIPRELDAIAMKALSEDPVNRYRDVKALQHDIRLYMSGYSVSVLNDHWGQLLKKLMLRNKLASFVVLLGVLIFLVISLGSYLNIVEQRLRAIEQRDLAEGLRGQAAQEEQRLLQVLDTQKQASVARIAEDKALESELERARQLSELEARVYSSGRGNRAILREFDKLIRQSKDPAQGLHIMERKCYAQIRIGAFRDTGLFIQTLKEKGLPKRRLDDLRIELHFAQFKTLDMQRQKFIQEMALEYPKSGFAYLLEALKSRERVRRLDYCMKAIGVNPRMSYALAIRAGIQKNVTPTLLIEDCNRALAISPKMALAYGNRGVAFFKAGDVRRAVNDLNKSLELDRKQGYAYRYLGQAYVQLDRVFAALDCYTQAIRLDPTDRYAHESRIQLAKGKKLDRWREYASEYRRAHPRDANRYLDRVLHSKDGPKRLRALELNSQGNELLKRRKFEEAVPLFEEAIKLDPDNLIPILNLADTLQNLNRVDLVIPLCLRAISLSPKDYRGYYQLTQCYLKQRNYKKAIEYCEKARSVNTDTRTIIHLGCELVQLHYRAGDKAKAQARALELTREYPKSGPPFSVLGQLQRNAGDLKGALKSFSRAIQLQDAQAFLFRALVYMKLNRRDEAYQDLLQALKSGPARQRTRVKSLLRDLKEPR
ncbi:MAG: tetratricopeptide repeat protein [Planctomycetota bacterium]|nr:tetratricopeptide repeat protein [Planctomycetota bacterium]